MKRKVLLYADAGDIPEIGTGHLHRCLLLARRLTETGAEVRFLTSSRRVADRAASAGYPCRTLPRGPRPSDVAAAVRKGRPDVVVWDRLDTTPALRRAIKSAGALLMALDDQNGGAPAADIVVNAMVARGDTPHKGFGFAILPKTAPVAAHVRRRVRSVTVCFGGYDHHRLSERTLTALVPLDPSVRIDLILSASAPAVPAALAARHGRRLRVHRAPPAFDRILARADVAVLAGGATLVQALSRGVPTLGIAQYEHQLDTLRRCERRGAAVCLGAAAKVRPSAILDGVRRLARDADARTALSRAAQRMVDGRGLERVRELATVVEPLPWDSDFFGVSIATLHTRRVTEDVLRFALDRSRKARVDCLYYLCDCHDPESVRLAERNGFHFVDIRLTFESDLSRLAARPRLAPGVVLRPARPSDIPALQAIAAKTYIDSRYFFDRRFSREDCERFYANWVRKACRGYADLVVVAARSREVLGYIIATRRTPATASIDLVSVAPGAEGSGLGKALVHAVQRWALSKGASEVTVVTQGRNYAAQRLYQAAGFKTQRLELWYHKWFDR